MEKQISSNQLRERDWRVACQEHRCIARAAAAAQHAMRVCTSYYLAVPAGGARVGRLYVCHVDGAPPVQMEARRMTAGPQTDGSMRGTQRGAQHGCSKRPASSGAHLRQGKRWKKQASPHLASAAASSPFVSPRSSDPILQGTHKQQRG